MNTSTKTTLNPTTCTQFCATNCIIRHGSLNFGRPSSSTSGDGTAKKLMTRNGKLDALLKRAAIDMKKCEGADKRIYRWSMKRWLAHNEFTDISPVFEKRFGHRVYVFPNSYIKVNKQKKTKYVNELTILNESNRIARQCRLGMKLRLPEGVLQMFSPTAMFSPLLTSTPDFQGLAAQAGSTLKGYALGPLNTFKNTADFTREASAAATEIRETATTTKQIANSLQDGIDSIKTVLQGIVPKVSLAADIGEILMKLVKILATVSMTNINHRIKAFFLEVFWNFGKEIYQVFFSLVTKYFNFGDSVEPLPEAELQIDMSGLISTITGTFTTPHLGWGSAPLTGALLSTLMVSAFGLPLGGFDSCLRFFGDRCRTMTNIKNAVPIFQYMAEWIKMCFYGPLVDQNIDSILDGYAEFVYDVLDLNNVDGDGKTLKDRLEVDEKLVFKIDTLYRRGIEFSKTLTEKRFGSQHTLQLNQCMKIVEKMKKLSDNTGVFGNKPRMEPLVIHLFGDSGVGKSGMSWPLASDLNAALVDNDKDAEEFAKNIYLRATEQEFWDGYHGQNVVLYDDFGQRVDSAASPNEEFMELIRTANIAPYPLHMASIEEKQRTKFCSKVVLLTSNVLEQNVNSLTFVDAYRRRIHICGKVTNVKGTTYEAFSKTQQKFVPRLDTSKTAGPVDTSVYEITLYDAETQQPLCRGGESVKMNYDEFLDVCLKKLRALWYKSRALNKELTDRMNPERAQLLRATLQINNVEDTDRLIKLLATTNDSLDRHIIRPESNSLKTMIMEEVNKAKDYFLSIVSSLSTIKGILVTVSALLTGFGLWCWFSKDTKPKAQRELGEGPPQRGPTKKLKSKNGFIVGVTEPADIEAHSSGDMNTRNTKRATREICEWSRHNDPCTHKHPNHPQNEQEKQDFFRMYNEGSDWSTIDSYFGNMRTAETESVQTILNGVFDYTASYCPDGPYVRPPCSHGNVRGACFLCKSPLNNINGVASAEACSSGDCRTVKSKTATREAFSSGDSRTVKSKRATREIEELDAEMQVWKDKTAQELISHRIISNTFKILKRRSDNSWLPLLNGLFIRDNIMLVPYHLIPSLQRTDTICIESVTGARFELPFSDVIVERITSRNGHEKDAALLQFPRFVGAYSDIVKHFQLNHDLGFYSRAAINLFTLRNDGKRTFCTILGNKTARAVDMDFNVDGEQYQLREGYTYDLPTNGGDCGAPLILQETTCLRKIAGIHVLALKDGNASYAQSVTREDLERTLPKLKGVIITDFDVMANLQIKSVEFPFDQRIDTNEVVEVLGLPAPTFSFVGDCDTNVFVPGNTDIRRSIIHGEVSEPITMPAYLYSASESLLHKNLSKCALETPYIPQEAVAKAVASYRPLLFKGTNMQLARVLTFEEAVEGLSAESEYLSNINRSSSPGFPWVLYRPGGTKGKTAWLGEDSYVFDEVVKNSVQTRIDRAAEGLRTPCVWTDTLKDERRPIEKVKAMKTRVFGSGPMDYTLAFRMFFLGFLAHVMENRIDNEQSLGTNVYSGDWKMTHDYLQRRGKKVIAGDFSTFDGTLNSCIMWEFVEEINRWYNDGERNALIRRTLFLEVINSMHLCDGMFYTMNHSQPSGNPITTALNSFYNSVSMRIVYDICRTDAGVSVAETFNDHVNMVSYGDDNVVNFDDDVAPWFNQNTITKAYLKIGMIYTDEAKTGGVMEDFRNIGEVAYLKRHFRSEEGRVYAPLDLSVILETCNWIRDTPDIIGACKENCENSIMELAQHPRVTFDEYVPKITTAFREASSEELQTKTYAEYEDNWIEKYFI